MASELMYTSDIKASFNADVFWDFLINVRSKCPD